MTAQLGTKESKETSAKLISIIHAQSEALEILQEAISNPGSVSILTQDRECQLLNALLKARKTLEGIGDARRK